MTAGEAIAQARALRPGCGIAEDRMKEWLRRQDGEIRARMIEPGAVEGYETAGADLLWEEGGLADSAELLAPFPFDGMYPHYLCAMADAAGRGPGGKRAVRRGDGPLQRGAGGIRGMAAAEPPAPRPAGDLVRRGEGCICLNCPN